MLTKAMAAIIIILFEITDVEDFMDSMDSKELHKSSSQLQVTSISTAVNHVTSLAWQGICNALSNGPIQKYARRDSGRHLANVL